MRYLIQKIDFKKLCQIIYHKIKINVFDNGVF
jgi:hypothetical protein